MSKEIASTMNPEAEQPAPIPERPLEAEPRARMVVISTISFQELTAQPLLIDNRFGRDVKTSIRPYRAYPRLDERWVPLDVGWLRDRVVAVGIENTEGRKLITRPTPEQRAEIDARVIEVAVLGHDFRYTVFATIRPGQCLPFAEPDEPGRWFLRCRNGTARAIISVWPMEDDAPEPSSSEGGANG